MLVFDARGCMEGQMWHVGPVAVLIYVLQLGMLFNVMLIACATDAPTSRCAAGCVQV